MFYKWLLGGHVFQQTEIILELIKDTIKTNVLTKFQVDLTMNVTLRVLTIFLFSLIKKNAPPPCGHVFKYMKCAQNIGSNDIFDEIKIVCWTIHVT